MEVNSILGHLTLITCPNSELYRRKVGMPGTDISTVISCARAPSIHGFGGPTAVGSRSMVYRGCLHPSTVKQWEWIFNLPPPNLTVLVALGRASAIPVITTNGLPKACNTGRRDGVERYRKESYQYVLCLMPTMITYRSGPGQMSPHVTINALPLDLDSEWPGQWPRHGMSWHMYGKDGDTSCFHPSSLLQLIPR